MCNIVAARCGDYAMGSTSDKS